MVPDQSVRGRAKSSTILIVEDDPDIRACFHSFFDERYEVVTAANGEEALEKLRHMLVKPCVVFLDLMMPVMNGWEFLEKVEHDGLLPDVEIVLITAAAKAKVPKNIAFLPKPFSFVQVEEYARGSCNFKCGRANEEEDT